MYPENFIILIITQLPKNCNPLNRFCKFHTKENSIFQHNLQKNFSQQNREAEFLYFYKIKYNSQKIYFPQNLIKKLCVILKEKLLSAWMTLKKQKKNKNKNTKNSSKKKKKKNKINQTKKADRFF